MNEVKRYAPRTVVMLLEEQRPDPALADSTPLRPEKSFLCGSRVDAEFRGARACGGQ